MGSLGSNSIVSDNIDFSLGSDGMFHPYTTNENTGEVIYTDGYNSESNGSTVKSYVAIINNIVNTIQARMENTRKVTSDDMDDALNYIKKLPNGVVIADRGLVVNARDTGNSSYNVYLKDNNKWTAIKASSKNNELHIKGVNRALDSEELITHNILSSMNGISFPSDSMIKSLYKAKLYKTKRY